MSLHRIAALVLAGLLAGSPAAAFQLQPAKRPAAPTESFWKPADTPPGGVSWAVLESTTTTPGASAADFPKPVFPAAVRALGGKPIKVNGYILPLQNGPKQTHFILLAYPPDCPFHLNPGPQQFIEVKTTTPVAFDYGVKTIQGTLELVSADKGGVFYRISNGRMG